MRRDEEFRREMGLFQLQGAPQDRFKCIQKWQMGCAVSQKSLGRWKAEPGTKLWLYWLSNPFRSFETFMIAACTNCRSNQASNDHRMQLERSTSAKYLWMHTGITATFWTLPMRSSLSLLSASKLKHGFGHPQWRKKRHITVSNHKSENLVPLS